MSKKRNLYQVCMDIRSLTEKDFKDAEAMAQKQINFIHPLKGEKQRRVNALGMYNRLIIRALERLKKKIDNAKIKPRNA